MPPLYSPPLYSMKPSLRNLFMKKLTRDRVVPIIPFAPNRLLNVKDRLEAGSLCPAPGTHNPSANPNHGFGLMPALGDRNITHKKRRCVLVSNIAQKCIGPKINMRD